MKKLIGGDSVCILDGLRIQIAQPKEGFIVKFFGDAGILSIYCSTVLHYTVHCY